MAESMGGKLESLYFAFGGVDAFVILNLPDNVTGAATALAASQIGTLSVNTVVLLTPEEMDATSRKSVGLR
jgi:uncharacterized protein with GYD domain